MFCNSYNNSWLWIIVILILLCGSNGGCNWGCCDNNNGCGNNCGGCGGSIC